MELGIVPQFPQGSPHRYYLLRIPLKTGCHIDEDAVRASPKRATVRRFWPSQADLRGYVVKTSKGWAFSYDPTRRDDESIFDMGTGPIRVGECITLTEPDGERLPFSVTSVQPLD